MPVLNSTENLNRIQMFHIMKLCFIKHVSITIQFGLSSTNFIIKPVKILIYEFSY
jgi:hypothetical protein